MKYSIDTEESLDGKYVKIVALNKYDGHAREDYSKDWIGQRVKLKGNGVVEFENGLEDCLLMPFEVELIEESKTA